MPKSVILKGASDEVIDLPYLFWCLRSTHETLIVDAGASLADAQLRDFRNFASPDSLLAQIGVDASAITTVLFTHLHYDHFSAWGAFPAAEFLVQGEDIEFFTGIGEHYPSLGSAGGNPHEIRELDSAGRFSRLGGCRDIRPGLRVHHVGGHTPGSQVVEVLVGGTSAVICGDLADTYDNLVQRETPPDALNRIDAVLAIDRILALVDGKIYRALVSHDPDHLQHLTSVGKQVWQYLPERVQESLTARA
ncbi:MULTISPECIES: MBL fold metallo-hydrolase [unclassified Microbacterium]|uniref:MBL fold metallo-hydrolase n=1 Tax=unclassified Microbacterium TaxID=2609290 RepID=UPI00214B0E45|nr:MULTISPECIES: MBL fold metallo-hydrolase [unclassified Microbacterium]MCR2811373.1 MBL fold metallo-hydrolase [Microbacterium sp. zg.B185]WIM19581.1 MBL fold metallo-hydrolase [Microbacterium sp. zg-B185]